MNLIRYVKRKDIDVVKWDQCIDHAANGLIYAFSFYLDAMCTNWDALILDDYKAVMPLPWRRKYFIYYIYQPFFLPSLGVFGNHSKDFYIDLFLNSIPTKFKYWDIDLNENNKISKTQLQSDKRIKLTARNNYFIDLNKSYEALYKNYRRLAKRKLHKAAESGLVIEKDISPEQIIWHYAKNYKEQHAEVPMTAYNQLLKACSKAEKKYIKTYLTQFKDGEIASFYLLLEDEHFIYSLFGGSTAKGKEAASFYLLTDAVIKDHANTNKIFRFEGSDIPGIAFFNQQFNPYLVQYVHLNSNKLPWPLRLIKK
jgi:hypothetical protein